MAAINFPNSPVVGDIYIDNGAAFQWDGEKWKAYETDTTVFSSAKNQTGATIAKGTPVYVNGTVGSSGVVTIAPMIADGTVPSKRYIGVAGEDIANGSDGKVTSFGYLHELNTTGSLYSQTWTEGQILYISQTTAGYLTNVEPTSGLVLPVAVVVNVHANAGHLIVRSDPAISATAEQGVLANTALQPGDNISELTNDSGYATQTYVDTAVANVIDSAPGVLDTLNELAAALGDDANFSTTVTNSLASKQATLVSGTNIKTVNSTSLLGSGDLAVQPTLVSGTNIKTVNSTSLLGSGNVAVQPTLVSGTNIKTINNTSLLGSGNISITSVTSSTYSTYATYADYAKGFQLAGSTYSININGGTAPSLANHALVWDPNWPNYNFTVKEIVLDITAGSGISVTESSAGVYQISASGGGATTLDGLNDVVITNPTSGETLLYNGTNWYNGTAGTTPPEPVDVYRSTRIPVISGYRNGSYNLEIQFATAQIANHVRDFMIAISQSSWTMNPRAWFYTSNERYYLQFDSNFASWSYVSGTTLYVQNYYVSYPANGTFTTRVDIQDYAPTFSLNSPTEFQINVSNIGALHTLNPLWYPHGLEFNYSGQPYATRIMPTSSPTLTPAITASTSPAASVIFYTFDSTNNTLDTQWTAWDQPNTYVMFTLGKYELVDPNAPTPWYSVQGAQGTASLSGSMTMPTGFTPTAGNKLVGMGNCHNYSGGANNFTMFVPSTSSGPTVGSAFSNNSTITQFTYSTSVSSPVPYDSYQGYGVAAMFTQPSPNSATTTFQYTFGTDNYTYDNTGFFQYYGYVGSVSNNQSQSVPSGGTVKFKAVFVFPSNITVTVSPTYASTTNILLEEFLYQDPYYGNYTKYVFFTCTDDTVARAMAAENPMSAPYPLFSFSSPTDCLAWAWWERSV